MAHLTNSFADLMDARFRRAVHMDEGLESGVWSRVRVLNNMLSSRYFSREKLDKITVRKSVFRENGETDREMRGYGKDDRPE